MLQVLGEVWEAATLFRETAAVVQPAALMHSYFQLKTELFCRGRALYDPAKREYPLHKAVFESNLPLVSRLIKCAHEGVFFAEKNELDAGGNTPLVLAVKLGNVDAVKVLTDLFTCPKLKSLSYCKTHSVYLAVPCALDVASAVKHKEMLRILLEANQKIKQHYLDLHKDAIFASLEALPDFKIDLNFSCKSNFIPFVRNIAPSDTYKIFKQGSKIRLDMTLVGFKTLKCVRGNLSVLFKGRGQENDGELFVVDHDSKSVSNIFNDVACAKVEKDLEDILADQQYQKLFKADKFRIEPELDKRGEIRAKTIEGFRAEKHTLKTQFTMTKFRVNLQEVQSLQRFKTFDEYLAKNSFDIAPHASGEGNPHLVRVETEQPEHALLTQGVNVITSNTMQGFATDKKVSRKTISASLWLSTTHPLSLASFLPLLEVLSFSSKQISKFKDHLVKYQLPKGSFPLKAKVPLFLTMKAAFSLTNLSFDTSDFAPNLFTVDEEYLEFRLQHSL